MKVQAAFVKENTTQVKVDDLDKYENLRFPYTTQQEVAMVKDNVCCRSCSGREWGGNL